MNLKSVHHIAIIVSDHDRALDFYVNKLREQVIYEGPDSVAAIVMETVTGKQIWLWTDWSWRSSREKIPRSVPAIPRPAAYDIWPSGWQILRLPLRSWRKRASAPLRQIWSGLWKPTTGATCTTPP